MLNCFLERRVFIERKIDREKVLQESDFISQEGFGAAKWGMSKLDVLDLLPGFSIHSNDMLVACQTSARRYRTAVAMHFHFDMLYRVRVVAEDIQEEDIEADFVKKVSAEANALIKTATATDTDRTAIVWESGQTRVETVYNRSRKEAAMEFSSRRYPTLNPPRPLRGTNS